MISPALPWYENERNYDIALYSSIAFWQMHWNTFILIFTFHWPWTSCTEPMLHSVKNLDVQTMELHLWSHYFVFVFALVVSLFCIFLCICIYDLTILYLYLHLWSHFLYLHFWCLDSTYFVFVNILIISHIFVLYSLHTIAIGFIFFSKVNIIICSHLSSASVQRRLLCLHIRSRPTRLCSDPPGFPRWSTEMTFSSEDLWKQWIEICEDFSVEDL